MTGLLAQVGYRLKAVVAAVLSVAAAYAATAISTGDPLTLHGLEAAIVSGLLVGVGVHQTSNSAKPRKAKPPRKH